MSPSRPPMAQAREPGGPPRTGDSRPPKPPLLKVNLKIIDQTKNRPSKDSIFKTICVNLKGYLCRLSDTSNGFAAYSDLTDTIDSITSQKGVTELKKLNLEPVTPPEIRAKRTVFVRGLDHSIIKNHSINEICNDLTERQPWLTNINIFTIKDHLHVFKIVCSDNGQADRILTDGLMTFNIRIPPYNCSLEKFTHLQICFNCYAYESHSKDNCPSRIIVCSECAQTGHTHRDCTSTTKKCLNCPPPDNNHRTLAPSCPIKRKAIREKEKKINDEKDKQTNKTYSQIVKTAIRETEPTPRPTINITDKTNFKLVALIIEAHVAAITGDRPYNDILSESLRLNYNLDAKFPDRDSQRILDIYLTAGQTPPQTNDAPHCDPDVIIAEMEEDGVYVEEVAPVQQPSPLPQRHPGGGTKPKKRTKASPDPPHHDQTTKTRRTSHPTKDFLHVKPT